MTKVWRLIDANLNRLREGLRVVEDINRFIYDDKIISLKIKTLRHSLQKAYSIDRIKNRDILGDVATNTTKSELNRTLIDDIIIANFCRVTESARVLEEAFKIVDIKLSQDFKLLRYEIYEIERLFYSGQKD